MDPQVFIDINKDELRVRAESYHTRKWRFVNICGSTVTGGVELLYSFSNGETFENLRFVVSNGIELLSITDLYFNAFFFENETHDLYGVKFKGIAIDFKGAFYEVSVPTPMNPAAQANVVERPSPTAAQANVVERPSTASAQLNLQWEGEC